MHKIYKLIEEKNRIMLYCNSVFNCCCCVTYLGMKMKMYFVTKSMCNILKRYYTQSDLPKLQNRYAEYELYKTVFIIFLPIYEKGMELFATRK